MKKIPFAIFLILAFSLVGCKSAKSEITFEDSKQDTATAKLTPKIYKLKIKAINSDFNYSQLKKIDHITPKIDAFNPIAGKYIFYQFISTFKGDSFEGFVKDFHDVLIIKTDKKNNIIDAYQYTVEWAEVPFEYDLFKLNAENAQLENEFDISLLRLQRMEYWNENDKFLSEIAIVKANQ